MSETGALRIAVVGLGPIGREVVRWATRRPGIEVVGAADIDPTLAGGDLGIVTGVEALQGRTVHERLEVLLDEVPLDVMVQTSGSRFLRVLPQIEAAVRRGVDVVSSAEEMIYPHHRHPREAADLDDLARLREVTVVGTGINPGFVMDRLPALVAAVCAAPLSVRVSRVVDAATRRAQLQRKIGVGMEPAVFAEAVAAGRMGHVGLVESGALLAHALEWDIDHFEEQIEPVVADRPLKTAHVAAQPGQVAGLRHRVRGISGGTVAIDLHLEMLVGAPEPVDELVIEGEPPLRLRFPGGIPGDIATVAALLDAVPRVHRAAPGLRTVLELV